MSIITIMFCHINTCKIKWQSLTSMVFSGNSALTLRTKETKCSEYPFATSKHMYDIFGMAAIISFSL